MASPKRVYTEEEMAVMRYQLLANEKKRRARVEIIQNSFSEFIKQTFKTVSPGAVYHHNWHIDAIAEHLEAVRRGELQRLIINMPPRQLKSISTAVAFPAWLLGHDPTTQIMCGSYAAKLANKHSLDTQLVLGTGWYQNVFPDVAIDPRQGRSDKFVTTQRGHRIAVSTGSMATGEGADVIIIDDPTNPLQAESDAERETANDWFDQTITSRLNDKNTGAFVIVMQRLHEDDLSGHLLEKGGWEHLKLQAVAEETKTISIGSFKKTVKKGELLDPVRLSPKVLEQTKKDMTAYGYAGQMQQNPAPDEGGILKKKWWKPWPEGRDLPFCDYIIQTLDTSFGEKETADLSVILTWGLFKATGDDGEKRTSCILLDAEWDIWEYPELKKNAIASYNSHMPDKVVIEFKASGQSLLQDMRRAGVPVRKFKVEHDKVYRANVSSVMLEKGHVYYPEGREWAAEVIRHCAVFPNGKYFDIVDAATVAWLYIRKRFWLNLPDDDSANDRQVDAPPNKKIKGYGA